MATAAVLVEDNEIDHVLILAEGNKIDEWVDDFRVFTDLGVTKYKGSPERRARLRTKLDTVIVATYQTATKDLATFEELKRGKRVHDGPMIEDLSDKRILVVMDEMTVIGNRLSTYHLAVDRAIQIWDARALGMTATPVTNGMESFYNMGRILCPNEVGTVESFERDHVVYRNKFHVATKFKAPELMVQKMATVMLRKRKTDPDVVDQFPRISEDIVAVHLYPDHAEAYDTLDMMASELPEREGMYAFRLLQDFANHPASILTSNSKLADDFMQTTSTVAIQKMTCSKSEATLRSIAQIVAQGDQVIIFCDHVSVLTALANDIVRAKMPEPGQFHGGVSDIKREADKAKFKSGEIKVLLCSKAGERGINLPEASYIINYDVPLLHSSYVQRYNRGSRIGFNVGGILFVQTLMAAGTVEEGAVASWNNRNAQSDALIDHDVDLAKDTEFITAQSRLAMVRAARRKAKEQEDTAA